MWKHILFICIFFGCQLFAKGVGEIGEGDDTVKEPKLFQDDINVSKDDPMYRVIYDSDNNSKSKRNAIRSRKYIWREKSIPYYIDETFSPSEVAVIKDSMQEIADKSCIKFFPHTNERNWVKFVNGKPGCWSSVGRSYWKKGSQDTNLGKGCVYKDIIMHEIMHVLGFWHEQSRPDRDNYIEILWENIPQSQQDNFKKYSWTDADTQQKQYDYKSLLHYGKYAFSANGQPTILTLQDKDAIIGHESLSNGDIEELNLLYDCKSKNVDFFSQWSQFGPCDDKCEKKRQRFCTHKDVKRCPGVDRYGIHTETVKCSTAKCNAPVNGHWGRWGSFSECSVTCNNGTKSRTRECNDPAKKNGGLDCPGSSKEIVLCTARLCSLGASDCQFEHGLCIWHAETGKNYEWVRRKGKTPSPKTGPSFDHTTGSPKGYYVYAEASKPASSGDLARLRSDKFPATTGMCMSFWYHMYGDAMGELSVAITQWDLPSSPRKTIWTAVGNKGDKWLHAEVELISIGSIFSVEFVAKRGSGYRSDIALDDIYFKNHPCNSDS